MMKIALKYLLILLLTCSASLLLGQGHNGSPVKAFKPQVKGHYRPMGASNDTNTFIVNYDSADANIWLSSYVPDQLVLVNVHYTYPSDSSAANMYMVNSLAVAFDSLVNPYNHVAYQTDSIGGSITVDTLIIPIVQVNYSGKNDTVDIQLNAVDGNGYPTSTVLNDTKLINTNFGVTDSLSPEKVIKVPENYIITGTRFAVSVKYMAPKIDSCWFVYGFGSYVGTCDSNIYTLAGYTNFSAVNSVNGAFYANSFVQYNKYSSWGYLPTANGDFFDFTCNSDTNFAITYYQNINVYAQITTLPLGIEKLTGSSISVSQNYPNPFTKSTQITYCLSQQADVAFSLCDAAGRNVARETYNKMAPGQHTLTLDMEQFSPGIYLYTFTINGQAVTRKMVVE